MNVGELKEFLNKFPDDMDILYCLYSDYDTLRPEDISTVNAVMREDGWAMRSHPTMSAENKANQRAYLLFPGN